MPGRTIAISSGKGGTGKTFLTANLGIALAKMGKKVVMIDADLDMANLELILGLEGRPITLQDVLSGEANLQDALYDVTENAKFVPAGITPSQFRRADPEKLGKIISDLTDKADFIILDCPAGVGRDTLACLSSCKETILVVMPEPMSATDAYKTKIVAEKMGSEIIGVVINMIKNARGELNDKEIASLLETKVLGRIPDDALVREHVIEGKPIVKHRPDSPAALAVGQLAGVLTGAVYIPAQPKQSLLEKLKSIFKRKR